MVFKVCLRSAKEVLIIGEKPKNLESSDGEDQHVRFHGAPDLISLKIDFQVR
tara:strand:- start:23 stop:178 length:156 start_codon:yes stop_codon:yes gene_type:complete